MKKCNGENIIVALYHKPLVKLAPDQFCFIANSEPLCSKLLKKCIIWLQSISWTGLNFQNVYISMDLTITFWHLSQNNFCWLYDRFVMQGHICKWRWQRGRKGGGRGRRRKMKMETCKLWKKSCSWITLDGSLHHWCSWFLVQDDLCQYGIVIRQIHKRWITMIWWLIASWSWSS